MIDKHLGTGDFTAIVRASAGLGALQDFTTDKAMLRAATDQIRWKPSGRGGLSASQALGSDPAKDREEFGVSVLGAGPFQYQEDENYRELVYSSPFGGSVVDLRLRSSYLSARKNQWLAQTALWVDAQNLTLDGPVSNRSGIIHLLVRAFSVNGAVIDGGIDQLLRVSLNEEGYARAMKYGLVYSTSIPIVSLAHTSFAPPSSIRPAGRLARRMSSC